MYNVHGSEYQTPKEAYQISNIVSSHNSQFRGLEEEDWNWNWSWNVRDQWTSQFDVTNFAKCNRKLSRGSCRAEKTYTPFLQSQKRHTDTGMNYYTIHSHSNIRSTTMTRFKSLRFLPPLLLILTHTLATSYHGTIPRRNNPNIRSWSRYRGGEQQQQQEENVGVKNLLIDEDENKAKELRSWQLQQQHLLQLRSIYLSELLHQRGVPIATVSSVATLDGEKAEPIGWECALSTEESPKSCLYSFDAPIGTKVVAPATKDNASEDDDDLQWISLAALNRLRRSDPSKVEPMWHGKYAIRDSWFGESQYSILQHVDIKGWALSTLLDSKFLLKSVLSVSICLFLIVFMPQIEYLVQRIIVSSALWRTYNTWGRFVNAALPFKLLMVQMMWKFFAARFDSLETLVRNYFVELECDILEQCVPVTLSRDISGNDNDDLFDVDALEDDSDEDYRSEGYLDDEYDDE